MKKILAQRLALDKAEVEQGKNMGMLQHCQNLRLLRKLLTLCRKTERCVQKFDSHNMITDIFVLSPVDPAEGATINLSQKTIVANLLADRVVLIQAKYSSSAVKLPARL